MALNSQGVEFRRISSAANTTAVCSTKNLHVDSTDRCIYWTDAAADFTALNFTSGMRITIEGSTLNAGIYTCSSATTTSIGLYDVTTAIATGVTLTITGHTYELVGGVKGIAGPSGNAAVLDITDLNSTARRKLIGLRDEGQVTLDVFFDNETATSIQTQLIIDRANRTLQTFDMKFTDGDNGVATSYPSGWNFDAYVSGFSINAGVDAPVSGSITLELTSAIKYIPKV